MQPVPAAVTACLYTWSCTSPQAKTPSTLVRLVLEGDRVVGEERLLGDRRERLRLVKQAPDGALYVLTDGVRGKILRVTPAGS